jgi:proteasome activator subunit 4
MDLLNFLIDKTMSERGYSSTGRLLTRVIRSLSEIYPLTSRFVNTDEWDSPGELRRRTGFNFALKFPEFNQNHCIHWGKLYEARDVKIEWHSTCSV